MVTNESPMIQKHSKVEDVLALLIASNFVAFGIFLFNQAGLLTGGTAGLALLLHHTTSLSFGVLFFTLNLPFYYLAVRRMGKSFAFKTFLAIFLVSSFTDLMGYAVTLQNVNPVFCGVMGGLLIGIGMLVLFRHKASLGGFNILALYMQERFGISAGKFQMGLDTCIVIASFFVVSPWILMLSILGALTVNIVLAVNHKPGRYSAI